MSLSIPDVVTVQRKVAAAMIAAILMIQTAMAIVKVNMVQQVSIPFQS